MNSLHGRHIGFYGGIESVGIARDRPEFFGYPLLTQEHVKLRTSNFICIFTGTKVHEKFWHK